MIRGVLFGIQNIGYLNTSTDLTILPTASRVLVLLLRRLLHFSAHHVMRTPLSCCLGPGRDGTIALLCWGIVAIVVDARRAGLLAMVVFVLQVECVDVSREVSDIPLAMLCRCNRLERTQGV